MTPPKDEVPAPDAASGSVPLEEHSEHAFFSKVWIALTAHSPDDQRAAHVELRSNRASRLAAPHATRLPRRMQVTLADQQGNPNSPLYSAKTFQELGLCV